MNQTNRIMKLFLTILFFSFYQFAFAQSDSLSMSESILNIQNFKMYQTNNIWNFLKLDTRNGKVWQVQFSTESSERFTNIINDEPLIFSSEKEIAGRFELYPTKNIYIFILLDKLKGWTFQVQWSIKPEERFLRYIPN